MVKRKICGIIFKRSYTQIFPIQLRSFGSKADTIYGLKLVFNANLETNINFTKISFYYSNHLSLFVTICQLFITISYNITFLRGRRQQTALTLYLLNNYRMILIS